MTFDLAVASVPGSRRWIPNLPGTAYWIGDRERRDRSRRGNCDKHRRNRPRVVEFDVPPVDHRISPVVISHAASVCWLLASWERSAEIELALDDWAEFGLSRFSASRGLDTLELAGLVSTGRRPRRSPIVTILDATTPDV
jgi:hypothetical protein